MIKLSKCIHSSYKLHEVILDGDRLIVIAISELHFGYMSSDYNVDFKLYLWEYGQLSEKQHLMAHIERDRTRDDNYLFANLQNIQGEQNKGYGSIILRHFIEYMNNNDVSEIYGTIAASLIDDHENIDPRKYIEKLRKFYSKHGFTITDNNKLLMHLQK